MKSATTWGVLFSKEPWLEFRDWHREFCGTDEGASFVPEQVNTWPATSWKKFINRYLSVRGLSFLYPYSSHLSHFADVGAHFNLASGNFHVPTVANPAHKTMNLRCDPTNLQRYDEFWELIPSSQLVKRVGLDFECDVRRLKGTHQYRSDYVFTSRACTTALQTYSNDMFPLELNCWYGEGGEGLNMARAEHISSKKNSASASEIRRFMKDVGTRRELSLLVDRFFRKLRRR